MARYPNISDHGLIGDLQTAALVTTDGMRRLVLLPPVRLAERLRVAARRRQGRLLPDRARPRRLRDQAAVLARHRHADHPVHDPGRRRRGHDFMPIAGKRATDRHRLVRQIRVARGTDAVHASTSSRASTTAARTSWSSTETAPFRTRRHSSSPCTRIGTRARARRTSGTTVERHGDGLRWTADAARGPDRRAWCWSRTGGSRRRIPPDELHQLRRRHRRVLAELAAPVHLPRPLAGDGHPVRDDAQADDLRADRRAGRRAHRRAARAGRRRAQLGLPLHLDPGRLVLRLRAARPRLHWRRRPRSALAAGPGQRAGRAPAPAR